MAISVGGESDLERVNTHMRLACIVATGYLAGSYADAQRYAALEIGRHDLVHDAPISHIDLLMCRNTLMYFNAEAQARIPTSELIFWATTRLVDRSAS